jgi:hypothetical protein
MKRGVTLPERAGNVMKHYQRPKTLWKEMPRLPERAGNVCNIARDLERSVKDAMRCQRSENVSHSPVVLLKPFL